MFLLTSRANVELYSYQPSFIVLYILMYIICFVHSLCVLYLVYISKFWLTPMFVVTLFVTCNYLMVNKTLLLLRILLELFFVILNSCWYYCCSNLNFVFRLWSAKLQNSTKYIHVYSVSHILQRVCITKYS
jgi:hypothetical protein